MSKAMADWASDGTRTDGADSCVGVWGWQVVAGMDLSGVPGGETWGGGGGAGGGEAEETQEVHLT